jgi:ribosomal protein L37AE/L43A
MIQKYCPAYLSEVNRNHRKPKRKPVSWKHCPRCGFNIVEREMARDFIDDFWKTIKKLEDKGYSISQSVLFVSKLISNICK